MDDRDTPTNPEVAAKISQLAASVRRRSTARTRIANLAALEVLVLLGMGRDDPRLDAIAKTISNWIDRASDGANMAISGELAAVATERDALRARLEASEADRLTLKAELRVLLRRVNRER